MKIAAGIVLFNPEIDRLKANIGAVIDQCNHLYLVDNCSDNLHNIYKLLNSFGLDNMTLIENAKNEGIAKALNQLCSKADMDGYEWIITLDQDSVCPSNMVEEYTKYAKRKEIGMLSPIVLDQNKGIDEIAGNEDLIELDECITSGSMLKLSVWKMVAGFDESMFIDGVDFDLCHRLRDRGFKIICVGAVTLIHELGHITTHRFFVWRVLVKNHSPFRKYYIARNTVYLARKERTPLFKALLRNLKLLLINWIYEEDKKAKTQRIIIGTLDGLRSPIVGQGGANLIGRVK